ncbi:glycosyltransferase [Parvularcula dongshanensis]|uniref:Glycosyltransferase involved in cell wall biosynthesis n=1 Tax=Parvularcula dongshanensis TaxID=1173995 RepID=A0A840I0T8_9PROT|nr:glycosyltransferase [Parvularcula dongshanensis]MBB4657822.1 glycosyltransferase involved in cell wall biosynthesis [Parvularcula dongshanensis]
MKILFLHNNFPAQFGAIGQYLAGEGWQVTFMTQRQGAKADGIETVVYRDREMPKDLKPHPFLAGATKAVVTGASAVEVGTLLRDKKGYRPDLIVAHSGWGPGMYLKDVWSDVPYVGYFEWYYRGDADDITFLSGPDRPPLERARERTRNAPILTDLTACEAGLVPTRYQASQFPSLFRPKLTVLHDGIDTETYAPGDPGPVTFGQHTFRKGDEVVTYVARGMEPYRGFPEFMAALATVQKRRPNLRAIVVGEDRVAYGRKHPSGKTYKEVALEELDLDPARICFTGLLGRRDYLRVLQVSGVHAYLTVPFVLSWSSMEAMSAGCLMLASDTAPVREVMRHGENAVLADHRDAEALADALEDTLARRDELAPLRAAARRTILESYAARDVYPAKKVWFAGLTGA